MQRHQMGAAGLTRQLGGALAPEVPAQSRAGTWGEAASNSPRVCHIGGCASRSLPSGGSTPGSPLLPLSHTSQETCLQHREQSLHAGLANHLEFSRIQSNGPESHACKPALCWKFQAGFLTEAPLKPATRSVGIRCRQMGHRLEVGTWRGAKPIPAESGHRGEKPQEELREAHVSAANRGGLSTVLLCKKLVPREPQVRLSWSPRTDLGGHSSNHESSFSTPLPRACTPPLAHVISCHRMHISPCDSFLPVDPHVPLNLYFFPQWLIGHLTNVTAKIVAE